MVAFPTTLTDIITYYILLYVITELSEKFQKSSRCNLKG